MPDSSPSTSYLDQDHGCARFLLAEKRLTDFNLRGMDKVFPSTFFLIERIQAPYRCSCDNVLWCGRMKWLLLLVLVDGSGW